MGSGGDERRAVSQRLTVTNSREVKHFTSMTLMDLTDMSKN